MSELDVTIVDMEPMRVVSAHGFGPNPEEIAWGKILTFAKEKGLDLAQVRFFGFNNPNPSPGSPNYGYEQWMTVGPEVEAAGDLEIKEIPARRYASTKFQGLENIGRVWKELVLWFEDSAYKRPPHWWECLEELHQGPDGPPETWVFTLHLPIAE
jgi:effector-binding domain-containing protein